MFPRGHGFASANFDSQISLSADTLAFSWFDLSGFGKRVYVEDSHMNRNPSLLNLRSCLQTCHKAKESKNAAWGFSSCCPFDDHNDHAKHEYKNVSDRAQNIKEAGQAQADQFIPY
jgi:hypothetical protein